MTQVIYTIKNEPPDFVAYVLPYNWEKPKELCRSGIAKDVVKEVEELYRDYGELKRVSNRTFQEAVEDRTCHSDKILHYLKNLDEGSHVHYYLYGSSGRPINRVWASMIFDTLIQVNREETGYYTYILTVEKLSRELVDEWALTFISRPHPEKED